MRFLGEKAGFYSKTEQIFLRFRVYLFYIIHCEFFRKKNREDFSFLSVSILYLDSRSNQMSNTEMSAGETPEMRAA
jgi:hypothetical protein